MKTLYVNGDSFTFGMECLGDRDRTDENKQLAFPKYVADSLNCSTYINNSYNGATNDFIFKRTIFDLTQLENSGIDLSEVFVIIGWTSLHRIEIDGVGWLSQVPSWEEIMQNPEIQDDPSYPREFKEFGTIFANPGSGIKLTSWGRTYNIETDIIPWCARFIWTETVLMESQEARIIALHEILKAKGCNHLFLSTCVPLERTKHLDLTCKNFYNIHSDSFYEYALSNGFKNELREFNHFTPVPHISYANTLVDYIKTTLLA